MGYTIGPDGQSYADHSQKHIKDYQLGHVFVGTDSFNKAKLATLLIGVESTAPGSTSPFRTGGKSHTIKSGAEDQTVFRAGPGTQKFEPFLGNKAPAPYGEMVIILNQEQFEETMKIFKVVLSMKKEKQKELFKALLPMNAKEAAAYLHKPPDLNAVYAGETPEK